MSGEDERRRQETVPGGMRAVPKDSPRPAAGSNPFLAEAPVVPAPVRRRGGKPPPGIISAGGVDMARAHASNIRPAADTELPQMETEKVVVSVETNPRRVQTMRNLEALRPPADGAATANGASPWAHGPPPEPVDKTALPSSNLPRERDTLVPPAKRKEKQAAFWIRVTAVAVFLLLIAGVTKRMGMWTPRTPPEPVSTPHVGGPLIPEPLPDDSAATAPSPSGAPTAPGTAQVGEAIPDDSGDIEFEPVPKPIRVRPNRPTPPPTATAASTGTFKPLFELPNSR
jgi:hypothetical protein